MYKELYNKISRIILEYFLQGNEPDEYTDYTMEEWSHETGVDYKPLQTTLIWKACEHTFMATHLLMIMQKASFLMR